MLSVNYTSIQKSFLTPHCFANTGPYLCWCLNKTYPTILFIGCFSFHILLTFLASLHLIVGPFQVAQIPLVKHPQLLYPAVPSCPHLTGPSAAVDRAGITLPPKTLPHASPQNTHSAWLLAHPRGSPNSPSLACPPLRTFTGRKDCPGSDLVPFLSLTTRFLPDRPVQ